MASVALPVTTNLARDWDFDSLSDADGTAVSSLPDNSAGAAAATQDTVERQPILNAAAVNTHNAATFDGSQTYLSDSTKARSWSDPFTWHIVAKPTLGSSPGTIIGGTRDWPRSQSFIVDAYGFDGMLVVSDPSASKICESTTATTAAWHIYTVVYDGLTYIVYQDGTIMASGSGGNTGTTTGMRIGAEYSGTAGTYYDPFRGQIARISIFSSNQSVSDLNTVVGALGTEYNISVSEIVEESPYGKFALLSDGTWKKIVKTSV